MPFHKPGRLVSYRDREWMVLPSSDPEILKLKPLGGSDHEITGVFLPLKIPGEDITEARFPWPSCEHLGSFETARLLYDASRLLFRNAAGPFRAMGKLSFQPRAYQMVPLVMSLKQKKVRLLIADDVGVGKTIEALIILQELIERGDIQKFAVICPPHLCEQWQKELSDKIDIKAQIIRSSTAASLDRQLPDDRSIFYHLPYQVISIDYIKMGKRRSIFLNDCPECVIVDEAHICALPEGGSKSQKQRYALIADIAKDTQKHMLLLTATPHSGKDSEFISLLGLLNHEFLDYDFANIQQSQRRKIASYFIQRKRKNIQKWMKQTTPFPERESKEIGYHLFDDYKSFYQELFDFARQISITGKRRKTHRIRYWTALALLRGAMSSPEAGFEMLNNRRRKLLDKEELQDFQDQFNPIFDHTHSNLDEGHLNVVAHTDFDKNEKSDLESLCHKIQFLYGIEKDNKARNALEIVKQWLKQGFHPIIFCKYIATAKYLGSILKTHLSSSVDIKVITSALADEQRKEQIDQMGNSHSRVLIATDCLSEGINLQDHFTAVLHYDLPWNPNRIEQRDGRIDRFGQTTDLIQSYILWGKDNPIDEKVLNVLVKKVRDIQRATGVSIPMNEDSKTIMDEILNEILIKSPKVYKQRQLIVDQQVTNELEAARKKSENVRSIFAHESIKPDLIEQDIMEVNEAIGDIETLEYFVTNAIIHLGASIKPFQSGYEAFLQNLPPHLKSHFKDPSKVLISFDSPTPKGYHYLGRNHLFVEQLCQLMLSIAFEKTPDFYPLARVSEIMTRDVSQKTIIVMLRMRIVIKEKFSKREMIAEEMFLWGYAGSGNNMRTLDYSEAKELLQHATSIVNLSEERQHGDISRELECLKQNEQKFLDLAIARAENLVSAHDRFKALVAGRQYEKATPVLPPDIIGMYILIPEPTL
jgi:ERCC4-related helicase